MIVATDKQTEMDKDNYALNIACASTSLILLAAAVHVKKAKQTKRKRKIWVKEWLQNREISGAYNGLMSELKLTDREWYRRYIPADVLGVSIYHFN